MAKREKWHLNEENEASALNKKEIISIFVSTLTDIYTVKSHLLEYLPTMAERAKALALKLGIMDTTIDVKTQLLRLDMVLALLKEEQQLKPRDKYNDFNLNSYLRSGLDENDPFETDVAMLTHLIMIESLQITTFAMMKDMAHAFGNRAIDNLIRDNLKDATENHQIFKAMMNDKLAKASVD